jgi:GAF domain-containing protein
MPDSRATPADEFSQIERDNLRLRNEIQVLRQFIDSMQNVVEAVENPLPEAELMDLLSDVLQNALAAINAKDGSLLVLDEDTAELVFVLTRGEIPRDKLAWRRIPPGEGIAGWVATNRKATIVNDVQTDERFFADVDEEFGFKTTSILAAPLLGGGQVLGVVEVLNKRGSNLFNIDDQTLLTLLCRFAGELLYSLIKQRQDEAGRLPEQSGSCLRKAAN